MTTPRRLTVRARVALSEGDRAFTVTGQTAKALLALKEAGEKGATALDCDAWAFRFAAYCHDLRKRHGLLVETVREDHDGGWHGRHILRSAVELVEIVRPEGRHHD